MSRTAWPKLAPDEIAGFAGRPYAEVAHDVIAPFVGGEIAEADLRRMCAEAYARIPPPGNRAARPDRPGRVGPRAVPRADARLQGRGDAVARAPDGPRPRRRGERATIVGATSGDTGGAAIEAFAGRESIDIFVLFPGGPRLAGPAAADDDGAEANVQAIAIEGHVRRCQAMVKALFNNRDFRGRLAVTGVNSINWARIVAQIVYYFTAAVALGAPRVPSPSPCRPAISATSSRAMRPSGWGCRSTGWSSPPTSTTSSHRTLATGRYEMRGVHATTSPSMDIQVSSNFERLLFEAYGRDAAAVRRLMAGLGKSGAFAIDEAPLAAIRGDFVRRRCRRGRDGGDDRRDLARRPASCSIRTPPSASRSAERFRDRDAPLVTLATAHPAKFPDAVEAATGRVPELPEWVADVMSGKETIHGASPTTSGDRGLPARPCRRGEE